MEKVLIHDNDDEDIHYIKESFLNGNETLCGQRLYPINTTYVRKFDVTCKECLEIVNKTNKGLIKKLEQSYSSLMEMHDKINELVEAINQLSKNK